METLDTINEDTKACCKHIFPTLDVTVINESVFAIAFALGVFRHGLDMSYRKHEPIKSKWRVTHQSYTPFDSVLLCLCLCVLFDLLKWNHIWVSISYEDLVQICCIYSIGEPSWMLSLKGFKIPIYGQKEALLLLIRQMQFA